MRSAQAVAPVPPPANSGAPSARSHFRHLLAAATVVAWVAFIAVALHKSRYPVHLGRYSGEYMVLVASVFAAAVALALLQLGPVYARLYAMRYQLLWMFVMSPLIALIAAEVAMRAFDLLGSSLYDDIAAYSAVFVPDDQLGYRNPPDYRGRYQGVEIATNSLGFRDRPLQSKSPGRGRVLVLGDSVAFGMGVPVERTFPRQLETYLRERWRSAEVVNSGVIGYNTRQELASLEKYGDGLQPDLVVLLYVDNDTDPDSTPFSDPRAMPAPWRHPGGAAWYLLHKSRIYAMLRHIGPVLVRGDGADFDRRSAGWQLSMASLARMSQYCRSRGVPFVVFHFRMLPNPKSDALNADIALVAARERFGFSDALPWFRGQNIRKLTNSFVDSHPNAEGHRILAEGMCRFLLENGKVASKQ